MSKESLVIHNPTHSVLCFRLDKCADGDIAQMAMHKQKRLVRTFSYNVTVPSRKSVDLVELSGLTLREIKDSPEYLQMQKYFQVMHDSSLLTPEVLIEEVDPVEVEDLDVVQPEDEIESVEHELVVEAPDDSVDTYDCATVDDVITETELEAELKLSHKKRGRKTPNKKGKRAKKGKRS